MVVPTGIGCAIGGYAGDALPSARLLAAASGCLITHPNVMNGASLYWKDPRIHYVEGYGLDRFAAGDWALRSVRQQRIGLLLDADLEPELRQRHLQVADGCRATLGIEIGPVVTSDVPLGVHLGLGLGCPVLGDHKFSSLLFDGKPQKIHGDILKRLQVRESKSRNLPMLLHAKRIQIPLGGQDEANEGRKQVKIECSLPHHFVRIMKALKLQPS